MKANFLFANDAWLWAIPIIALGGVSLWMASRWIAHRRLSRFVSLRAVAARMRNPFRDEKLADFCLTLAVLLLLVITLARPLTGPRPGTAERSGVDLVILLDISKSMLVEDVEPSRLGAVKKELREWLRNSAGDRISLVPFAGDAFVMAPLTYDYQALDFVLDEVSPRSISAGGTNVPVAIETATELLKREKDNARVILLVSDGENLEGEAATAARKAYAEDHVTILTVGVGTVQGGKVPIPDTAKDDNAGGAKRVPKGFVRNEYGTFVTSRLDERTLRAIAGAAGGRHYQFAAGADTFRTLQRQSLLPLAKKSQLQHLNVADYFEWFQLPLGLAIAVMAAASAQRLFQRKAQPVRVGVPIVQPVTHSGRRFIRQ